MPIARILCFCDCRVVLTGDSSGREDKRTNEDLSRRDVAVVERELHVGQLVQRDPHLVVGVLLAGFAVQQRLIQTVIDAVTELAVLWHCVQRHTAEVSTQSPRLPQVLPAGKSGEPASAFVP